MYGDWQVGALSAEEYVRTATRWARAIKRLDPDAVLVSCGKNGWDDWDRIVIDGLAPLAGLHSVHLYTGSDDYWTNVLQPHQAERAIRCARALIERAAYVQKITHPGQRSGGGSAGSGGRTREPGCLRPGHRRARSHRSGTGAAAASAHRRRAGQLAAGAG
jgi:hypothetical protein